MADDEEFHDALGIRGQAFLIAVSAVRVYKLYMTTTVKLVLKLVEFLSFLVLSLIGALPGSIDHVCIKVLRDRGVHLSH